MDRSILHQPSRPGAQDGADNQMGELYSSAKLTTVAATGDSPKYGPPGISHARQVPMPWEQVIGPVALVCTAVTAAVDVYRSTWAYRAWTFQGGGGLSVLTSTLFHRSYNVQSESLAVAARHVEAFSERHLTYDSNALNATFGIINRLSK
jgi:hypothetical protein